MQVKGIMPLYGGLTRQTPNGRAIGRFVIGHSFFEIFRKVMPGFYILNN